MSIIGNVCTECGSDRLGFVCQCGEMRCGCSRENCPTCEAQQEYENQQQLYEAEKQEREEFENKMADKYRR